MEFRKLRGTLFGGPYNKDPIICANMELSIPIVKSRRDSRKALTASCCCLAYTWQQSRAAHSD